MPDFIRPSGSAAAPMLARIPVPSAPAIERVYTHPPVRVVFVLYRDDLNIGGSLRVVEILANALDPKRVEAHIVFTYGEPGPIASRSTVRCHFLRAKGPLDVACWKSARALIDSIQPEIVHFHNPAYWLHAALIGKKFKRLNHLHGPFFPKKMRFLDRWLMARAGRLSDAAICITREMRQMVIEQGWGKPDKVWTVYNGIDCLAPASAPSQREARASLGLPENGRVLGVVCRLAWYKGCADGIRILEKLPRDWNLVFYGDGPMKDYLADLAKQAGLANRVHFTGMVDDMRTAYASMDAFLFLSKLEPFGLVIAEAMAARVPVFGMAAEGAYRDAFYPLITAENSVFVERSSPGDYISPEPAAIIEELAKEVARFGKNPEPFNAMVDCAQQWVLNRFDGKIQAEAMLEVYDFVLGRPTDSPR